MSDVMKSAMAMAFGRAVASLEPDGGEGETRLKPTDDRVLF